MERSWKEHETTAKPLGEIADYAIGIEFQARGSPHAHCVIWVKEYGVDHDSQVCDFIDQYVSCKLPKEDGKLRELVLLLQQHKHSSYCKRNKACRFNFPKPPSRKTLIAKSSEDDDDDLVAQNVAEVQKLIAEGNTNMSLDDLLDKAEVSESETTYRHWKCPAKEMLWYLDVCIIPPLISCLNHQTT